MQMTHPTIRSGPKWFLSKCGIITEIFLFSVNHRDAEIRARIWEIFHRPVHVANIVNRTPNKPIGYCVYTRSIWGQKGRGGVWGRGCFYFVGSFCARRDIVTLGARKKSIPMDGDGLLPARLPTWIFSLCCDTGIHSLFCGMRLTTRGEGAAWIGSDGMGWDRAGMEIKQQSGSAC